jgi:hypothetical protein
MTADESDRSTERLPEHKAAHVPARRPSVDEAVENAIRAAQARGAFDNLAGQGQPLKWDTEQDDDWWLANHMLKSAGYSPAWIDRDKAIRAERAALAQLLPDHIAWHREHAADEPPDALAVADRQAVDRYRKRAVALNREIDSHNLSVPIPSLQRPRVRVDDEVAAFWTELES